MSTIVMQFIGDNYTLLRATGITALGTGLVLLAIGLFYQQHGSK